MIRKINKILVLMFLIILILQYLMIPAYANTKKIANNINVISNQANNGNSSTEFNVGNGSGSVDTSRLEQSRQQAQELRGDSNNPYASTLENNAAHNNEDPIEFTPQENQNLLTNGDARFESESKGVTNPSFNGLGIIGGGLTVWWLYTMFGYLLVASGIINLGYLVESNPVTLEKYKIGLEKLKKDDPYVKQINGIQSTIAFSLFTLDKLFFEDFKLVKINVFKVENNAGNVDAGKSNTASGAFKLGIAKWSGTTRLLAISFSLIVFLMAIVNLIYRIALAGSEVIALQKAKQLITDLVISLLIAFFIPYLLAAILYFNDYIMAILNNFRYAIIENGFKNFEYQVYLTVLSPSKIMQDSTSYALSLITLFYLIFLQLKYLIVYITRLFSIAIMVLISPIIAVTYSLDKVGDNKSQILNTFISEFIQTVMLGPMYALMYLVFMILLSGIASTQPLLGVIILTFFQKMEKEIKKLLGIDKLTIVKDSQKVI